ARDRAREGQEAARQARDREGSGLGARQGASHAHAPARLSARRRDGSWASRPGTATEPGRGRARAARKAVEAASASPPCHHATPSAVTPRRCCNSSASVALGCAIVAPPNAIAYVGNLVGSSILEFGSRVWRRRFRSSRTSRFGG